VESDNQQRRPRRIFLWVLLAALLAFCYRLAEPFLWPLLVALMLAVALYPLHAWVLRLVKKPGRAALLSTLLTILIVAAPVAGVVTAVTNEAAGLYDSLSRKSQESGGWEPFLRHLVERPAYWLQHNLPFKIPDLSQQINERLKTVSAAVLARTGAAVGGLTSLVANSLLVFLILFFFFRDGRDIAAFAMDLLPLSRENTQRFAEALTASILANLYGVVAVAGVQGSLMGFGFWILGLPSPVLWGLVATFCSMIPLVGVALVWLPAAIVLLLQGATIKALLMAVWGVLFVGMSDNIIRPLIVRRGVRMHTLLVLFSILGGTSAFGLIGLVLGPVIVSITAVTVETLREELKPADGGSVTEPRPSGSGSEGI
jgi:predicted PurR-regulated permease PerM